MMSKLGRACVIVAALILNSFVAPQAFGVEEPTILLFKIPEIVVHADGVNATQGTISAQLDLWGEFAANPPTIASYNLAFELADAPAGVAFGAPQEVGVNQLFGVGNVYAGASVLPYTIRFAKDAVTPVPALNGGLMVTVPFTVDAGITSGTFPIKFIPGNELTNPNAEALTIVLMNGSIKVLAAPSLAGDYNGDGAIDAADYVVWRNTIGQTGAELPADGNGDGVIDAGDYDLWQAQLGRESSATTAALTIPEPITNLLIAVSGLLLSLARVRRVNVIPGAPGFATIRRDRQRRRQSG